MVQRSFKTIEKLRKIVAKKESSRGKRELEFAM